MVIDAKKSLIGFFLLLSIIGSIILVNTLFNNGNRWESCIKTTQDMYSYCIIEEHNGDKKTCNGLFEQSIDICDTAFHSFIIKK